MKEGSWSMRMEGPPLVSSAPKETIDETWKLW